MTAVDPNLTARQQERKRSLATIAAAQDRPLNFEECDALRMRVERLYAELAALTADTTSEWGVRLADGGFTNAHHSRQRAEDSICGLRTDDVAAVLVTRTVHRSAWTEATS